MATVTSKGQITLPLAVRTALGLTAGSRVSFVPTDVGGFELVPATGSVSSLKGVVSAPADPVTLEEMDAAIAAGAAATMSTDS